MTSKLDELPSADLLAKIADYPVLDRDGKSHRFQDLYAGPDATERTLILFVRHFFCGSCQEYLARLSTALPPSTLSTISPPTSIIVIGCGSPGLIPHYATQSATPYTIYADPSRKLYKELGMITSWTVGEQPKYISKSVPRLAVEGMWQALKQATSGLMFSGGPGEQQGGEFLFEKKDGEEGAVTWCHRMQGSWGRTEIEDLEGVLRGKK
ncbi:AhpC/TSA antioxidant enzyme-domain-containing protein [Aspergillus granulosus]|uniref:AhpC/TSA antioxidant enzyme-domain-containing protein n=1 Tax=Aspergillus granulosus TaxID=176169 RepID=A0ABR4H2E7_9EURO